jgi:hypothetical protein
MSTSIDIYMGVVTKTGGKRDVFPVPGGITAPVASLSITADHPIATNDFSLDAGEYLKVYDYAQNEQGYTTLMLTADQNLLVALVVGTPAGGSLSPGNKTAHTIQTLATVPLLLASDKAPTAADVSSVAGLDGAGVPLAMTTTLQTGRVYEVWVKNLGKATTLVNVARRG